nr:methyl-accepting chemotaxis protein [uncultured Methanospirillum sp.]
MNYINNINIRKKLIGSFLFIAAIVGFVAILGYLNLATMNEGITTIYHDRLVPIEEIGSISSDFNEIRGDMIKYALVPEDRKQIRTNIAKLTGNINTNLEAYKETYLLDSERENLKKLEPALSGYLKEVQTYLDLIDAGDNARAIAMLQDGTELSKNKINFDTYSHKLEEINDKEAEAIHEESESTFANSSLLLAIAGVLGVILSIILGYVISRNITGPLNRTVEMIQEMGKGHLSARLYMNRRDEIGIMAETMDTFADNLQKKVIYLIKQISSGEKVQQIPPVDEQDEIAPALNLMIDTLNALLGQLSTLIGEAKEGRLQSRADATRFFGLYRDMITDVNDMLDAVTVPLNETLRVADRYAEVDFSARFDDRLVVNGELLELKEKINQIGVHVGTELGTAIREINEQISSLSLSAEEAAASVEEVTSGASTVAQSSSVVSMNAEKSFQSIDQVLCAMEELTTSVSTVATKVEVVNRLSLEANATSTSGMEQAAIAEQGIHRINESVTDVGSIISEIRGQMNEIGKIVGIIGNIADQTNLLALNAAIEAARAGEAGMGFAVVADEVKTLAQESQGSTENIAKIIASLQQQSERASAAMNQATREVETGTEAIEGTIRFFHTIVEHVEDISRNMTEVASLAEEETAAVEEITASVSEVKGMSTVTAREAESSAAASEESSSALGQVSTVVSDLSIIAARINESMTRLNA